MTREIVQKSEGESWISFWAGVRRDFSPEIYVISYPFFFAFVLPWAYKKISSQNFVLVILL